MPAAQVRDAEESTTHTWNQVISVIKPFEVELPVEHHLHLEVYGLNYAIEFENAFVRTAIKNKLHRGTYLFAVKTSSTSRQSVNTQHVRMIDEPCEPARQGPSPKHWRSFTAEVTLPPRDC